MTREIGEEKPYPSGVRLRVGLVERAIMSASITSSELAEDDRGADILVARWLFDDRWAMLVRPLGAKAAVSERLAADTTSWERTLLVIFQTFCWDCVC